ncbi:MAG: Ig-like domain-containing protein [Aeromicrobium sp.]
MPLDLCDLLPALCASGVDQALLDLLGSTSAGTPEQLQESVEALVQAIIDTLTGVSGPDGQEAADAIATQLTGSGLDPAVITQVLAGLSGAGVPDSGLADLLDTVLNTVQELVTALLGLGGQSPDPAQVQALVDQITAALAAGDPAALQALIEDLLTSLPGGSGLDQSTLTGLVDQVVAALEGALGGGNPITQVIVTITDALGGGNAAPAPAPANVSATPTVTSPGGYFTSRRPAIRGVGAAGASVTVRTTAGKFLGSTTVSSAGTFVVTPRTLKIAAYRVTATQVESGKAASAKSAVRTFRIVSAKPVIKTTSRKKFSTHRPKITGIGYPKSRIVLRSSTGKKLGSAKVRADGTWTIKSKRLSSGTRKIKAVQTGHGKKKTSKVRTIRIR